MIVLVSTCADMLHKREFVDPIKRILEQKFPEQKIQQTHIQRLTKSLASKADAIIICGTALADNEYQKSLKRTSWMRDCETPILGICSGMHILLAAHGGSLYKETEIGMVSVTGEFSGEVYALHNFAIRLPKGWDVLLRSKTCVHMCKHPSKQHIGVLFHPEVRNEQLVTDFLKN